MQIAAALVIYALALAALALINRREFRRHPAKGQRYAALPIGYKLACWLGVVPLLVAAVLLHPALLIPAWLGFALLEMACVRWYKKADLL